MELDTANAKPNISTGSDLLLVADNIQVPLKQIPPPEPTIPSEPVPTQVPAETEIENKEESPTLTSELEALLGGLDVPTLLDSTSAIEPAIEPTVEMAVNIENDTTVDSAQNGTQPMVIDFVPTDLKEIETSTAQQDSNELLLQTEQLPEEDGHPEWEIDSSPIESSDDSSSDDSSSDESEDGENSYKLLSPEEQARILMEEGGGSDDEEAGKGSKGSGAQLRTKNEVPEVIIPKPDVTITAEMPIEELGNVEGIVENIVLIKANTSGEYRVLESGSVLCLADRAVIGAVSETLGRVQQPLYSVIFTNPTEVTEAGLAVGTKIFYSTNHAIYVFTQALKAYKGSDASNLHDEEVGQEEMEFSDDEAEVEHKRKVKQAKIERRGGKAQQNGGHGRSGHPLQQQHTPYDVSKGLSYDDAEDDGPYKPLARPVGYAESVGRSEAPQEGTYQPGMNGDSFNQSKDQFRGRVGDRGRGDRSRGKGRGDRGRGDRGRGRGGYSDRDGNNGHSLPPQGRPFLQGSQIPQNPAPVQGNKNSEYSPLQPQLPGWAQFPPHAPGQQMPMPMPPFPFPIPFPNMPNLPNIPQLPNMPYMMNGWPVNPGNTMASGAFINPAFYNTQGGGAPNQWNQNQSHMGRGGGRGQ